MAVFENAAERLTIRNLIERALEEDLGGGDVTTDCIIPETLKLKGRLITKEAGIIAGLKIAEETFAFFDKSVLFLPLVSDGELVSSGQEIAMVMGPACSILSVERTALNFLQRMSGIATETGRFVRAVEDSSAVILDTRKTVPGLRSLDKLAVKTGGGENHRFGLFDMVLIKENHIISAGGITLAVGSVRDGAPADMPVEVEVSDLEELREALSLNVDRILLDNMSIQQMQEAVRIAGGRIPLEASGNVTIERVREIAGTGVDYISVGSLTHSVKALDITLLFDKQEADV